MFLLGGRSTTFLARPLVLKKHTRKAKNKALLKNAYRKRRGHESTEERNSACERAESFFGKEKSFTFSKEQKREKNNALITSSHTACARVE